MTESLQSGLVGAAVVLPLIAAFIGLIAPLRKAAAGSLTIAGVAGILAALAVSPGHTFELPPLLLGVRLGLDQTGRTFLFFTSVLWVLASLHAAGSLRGPQPVRFFHLFLGLAMAGNFGVVLAHDAATFYFFFALMNLSSVGLVIHRLDRSALRAGGIYLIFVVAGEVLLFAGLMFLVGPAGWNLPLPAGGEGGPDPAALGLLTAAFGIKIGMLPFHLWMPLAYSAAPTPASAVLSGAMIKAGILGWLRLLPVGEAGFEAWGVFFLIAGLAAAFYGVAIGLLQTGPKEILAYSSVSQMGYLTMGIGAGMLEPVLWPGLLVGVTVYALHHSLAKGALFLTVGLSAARLSRWVWGGAILLSLSLAGAPLTSGAVAKSALKSSLHELPGSWPAVLDVLLPVAAIGTGLLMVRFLVVLRGCRRHAEDHRIDGWMVVAWAALVAASAAAIWWWDPGSRLAGKTLTGAKILGALWPVAVAGVIGWLVCRRCPRFLARRVGSVPPGDLLGPVERTVGSLLRIKVRHHAVVRAMPAQLQRILVSLCLRALRWEALLASWTGAVLALLALVLLFYVLCC